MKSHHTNLIDAIKQGNFQFFKKEIKNVAADFLLEEHEGKTLLHLAIQYGTKLNDINNPILTKLLGCLKKVCSEEQFNKILTQPDSAGWTPLHYVARYGCLSSFSELANKLGHDNLLAEAKKVTNQLQLPLVLLNEYKIEIGKLPEPLASNVIYVRKNQDKLMCIFLDKDKNRCEVSVPENILKYKFKYPLEVKEIYPHLYSILIYFLKAGYILDAFNPHKDSFFIRQKLEEVTINYPISKPFLFEVVDVPETKETNPLLQLHLKLGGLAINYALLYLKDSVTHPYANNLEAKAEIELRKKLKKIRDEYDDLNSKITFLSLDDKNLQELNNIVGVCKEKMVGNCYEFSCLVLEALMKMGVFSLACLTGIKNGDHVFVLLGLLPSSNINDFKTWGNAAVVIDAWSRKIFRADHLPNFLENFYFDPFSWKRITFPFNQQLHILRKLNLNFSKIFLSAHSENFSSAIRLLDARKLPFIYQFKKANSNSILLRNKEFANTIRPLMAMIDEFTGEKDSSLLDATILYMKSQSTAEVALALEECAKLKEKKRFSAIVTGIKDTHSPFSLLLEIIEKKYHTAREFSLDQPDFLKLFRELGNNTKLAAEFAGNCELNNLTELMNVLLLKSKSTLHLIYVGAALILANQLFIPEREFNLFIITACIGWVYSQTESPAFNLRAALQAYQTALYFGSQAEAYLKEDKLELQFQECKTISQNLIEKLKPLSPLQTQGLFSNLSLIEFKQETHNNEEEYKSQISDESDSEDEEVQNLSSNDANFAKTNNAMKKVS